MSKYSNSLVIKAVGDVMLGISSHKAIATGQTIPQQLRGDPGSVFEEIQQDLTRNDLLLGTLESPLSENFCNKKAMDMPFLLAPPNSLKAMQYAEFDCVSLANNHMLDHGEEVVDETISLLEESQINYVGDPFGIQTHQNYHMKNRDISIGGFNLCDEGKRNNRKELLQFIQQASDSDIIILLIHWGWGYEHLPYPSQNQIELGHQLIDNGADIVIGSHSHVLQPVEQYSDGLIAYSLGNFLFDMWREENKKTGILEIIHDEDGNLDAKIIPARIDECKVRQFSSNNHNYIQKSPPLLPSNVNKKAQIKKNRHRIDIICHYLRYCTSFPISFHIDNMKRWSNKVAKSKDE